MGAIGLAIKTAFYGLLTAEVYDWLNCRFLKIGYARMLIRKLALAAAVGVLAILLLSSGGAWLQRVGTGPVAALALSSGAYATAVAMMVLLWPAVAGISREQLVRGGRLLGWN
jgi:hypothetical protein